MDAAFAEALDRHPLLTARLTRRGTRRFWVPGDGPLPVLRWETSADEPPLPVGERIDLRRSAGIRGYVHRAEGRAHPRAYLDWLAAELMTLDVTRGTWEVVPVAREGAQLAQAVDITLGEDEEGELCVGRQDGRVLSIERFTRRRLPATWRTGR